MLFKDQGIQRGNLTWTAVKTGINQNTLTDLFFFSLSCGCIGLLWLPVAGCYGSCGLFNL